MITIDLLRHGELEGGVKYRGQTDDPLTRAGRADMNRIWQQLEGHVDLIISSPMSRCLQPAAEWAESAGVECLADPRIAEMHYGEWEGLTSDEIKARYPGMLEQWRADPEGVVIPGGESIHQLQKRIAGFWTDICEKHDGRDLLVVAHSGTVRMLIAHVLSAPIVSTRHMQMPYSCWSRVTSHNGSSQLQFHNRDI